MDENSVANTPAHCWECEHFHTCRQAQYMCSDTMPEAAFMGNAELLCSECAAANAEYVGDQETDYPAHCGCCGVPLECTLTEEGIRYLNESVRTGLGCCRELWPALYANYIQPCTYEQLPSWAKLNALRQHLYFLRYLVDTGQIDWAAGITLDDPELLHDMLQCKDSYTPDGLEVV